MTDPTPASDALVAAAALVGRLRQGLSGPPDRELTTTDYGTLRAIVSTIDDLIARLDEAERQRDWYADPRIDHHRDGPHLGWTCCPHGPDQSTTGGLCDTCGMPNPDLTAAAHDRIWWALHDRCWRAWAIDHRPAIDPYTARQHAARVAADAVAEWVAETIAGHDLLPTVADQLDADGHHHLALRCRIADQYGAAYHGRRAPRPSTALFAALYDACYPDAGLSSPGLLAERLRRYADRLDAAATAEMLAAHSREAA